jgi:hypothetical protein
VSIIIYIDNGGKKSQQHKLQQAEVKRQEKCLVLFVCFHALLIVNFYQNISSFIQFNVMLNIVNAHHGF